MILPPQKTVNPVRSPVRWRTGRRLWRLTSNGVDSRNKVEPSKKVQPWLLGLVMFFVFAVPTAQAVVGKPPNNLGLVGYWSFDECRGNIALDSSGNSNRGTLTNFALSGSTSNWITRNAAKRGCALNFDGSNDYVDILDSSSLDISGANQSSTISFWAKMPSVSASSNPRLVTKSDTVNSRAFEVFYHGTQDIYYCQLYDGTNMVYAGSTTGFDDNVWHHIVCIFSGAPQIYIDGTNRTNIASGTGFGQNYNNNINVNIGRSTGGYYFNGSLDEVRIYNRALTASEVASLYQSGLTKINASTAGQGGNLTTGLVGHWTFDGSKLTTTTATDSSGLGNNGTLTNGPVPTAGKLGQALSFDGVNDIVTVNDTPFDFERTNPFSVAAWIKTTDTNAGAITSKYTDNSSYTGYIVWITSAGYVRAGLSNTWATNAIKKSAVLAINDGTWHHAVVTYSGSSTLTGLKIFVDGLEITAATDTQDNLSASILNNVNLSMGHDNVSSGAVPLVGSLDDVRIYNRALSAAEVKQLYNLGSVKVKAPSNTGLVGYWSFNEGAGTTAGDFSGSGNRGTLTPPAGGGPTWIDGKFGKALSFDGSNDYVDTGAAILNGATAYTISAWVKPSDAVWRTVISQNKNNNWTGMGLFIKPSSNTISHVLYNNNGGSYDNGIATVSIPTLAWTHVVVTWNSAHTMTTYVNGASITTTYETAGTAPTSVVDNNVVKIGWDNRGDQTNYWNGSIDEVRIYNRALSAGEVQGLYDLGRASTH